MKVCELKKMLGMFDDYQDLKALVNLVNAEDEYVLDIEGVSTIEDDDRAFLVIKEDTLG